MLPAKPLYSEFDVLLTLARGWKIPPPTFEVAAHAVVAGYLWDLGDEYRRQPWALLIAIADTDPLLTADFRPDVVKVARELVEVLSFVPPKLPVWKRKRRRG